MYIYIPKLHNVMRIICGNHQGPISQRDLIPDLNLRLCS